MCEHAPTVQDDAMVVVMQQLCVSPICWPEREQGERG